MIGVNGGELIILVLVVALVVGPERLPGYAEQLGRWVRGLRGYLQDARRRVDDEVGDTGLDWEALDPRRYDPRRIVREALLDDPAAPPPPGTAGTYGREPAARQVSPDAPTPYDDEAT